MEPALQIGEWAMKDETTRKILVVDDHQGVRRGLMLLLEEAGMGRCIEAEGRIQALEIAGRELPDLALVDLSIGGGDAEELIDELCKVHIPVLVCSMHEESDHVKAAMAAGARGYITKGEVHEVVRAVRSVLEGWILISPRAAESLEAD